MKAIVLLVFSLLLLGGCQLIAAGIIGAEVEKEHRSYCAHAPFDPNCRSYWYGKHYGKRHHG